MYRLTSSKGGGDRVAGEVAPPGDEHHRVLGVRLQTIDVVLLVWSGNLQTGFIRGVGGGAVKHGDSVHRRHWLGPADQSRGVRHILHFDLPGAADLWGRRSSVDGR